MERSRSITRPPSQQVETRSSKSRVLAALLCFFFGFFGVHRFYVGKFWTGLLLLVSGGGLGIWWIVDLVLILLGRFKDSENRVLGPPRSDRQPRRERLERPSHSEARRDDSLDRSTDGWTEGQGPPDRSDDREVALDDDDLLEDPLEREFEQLEQEMNDRS